MNKFKALIVSLILTLTGIAVMTQTVAAAGSATLSVSPAASSHTVGSSFSVAVVENSGANTVNGVQADISFNSSNLQFLGKSCGGAFEIAAPAGGSSLACATVTAKTGAQTVGSVSFKVIAAGSASVSFLPSSQITASDGQGTNIYSGSTGGSYSLVAPVVAPKPKVVAPTAPQTTEEAKPAATTPVLSDTSKVATSKKTPAATPAPKKSNNRMIWSTVLLIAVLIAAAVIFVDPIRNKLAAFVAGMTSSTTGKTAAAGVVAASVAKSVKKKPASKKKPAAKKKR